MLSADLRVCNAGWRERGVYFICAAHMHNGSVDSICNLYLSMCT